jgi:alpha-1,3-rhamnosyltransferase
MLEESRTSRALPNAESQPWGDVSVVVPSFNHSPFIEKCLRSIFAQTLLPTKLLVIDDGSTDGSPAIIDRALRDCPFESELIVRENRGLCATLNEGLEKSQGEFFAYLGSDDLWFPEFLSKRIAIFGSRPKAVLAYGNAYSIDENDQIIDCTTDWAQYVDGDVRRMLLSTLAPLSPTVVYRKAPLERYGWNESANLEDYELYLRLSSEGEFAFDPRIFSAWRQHTYNASRNLEMMRNERLAAQKRLAGELGVSDKELNRFGSLAQFRSAQEFMRAGQKLRALSMMVGSMDGIPSKGEAIRALAGLLVPHRILTKWKARRRRRAGERYGELGL